MDRKTESIYSQGVCYEGYLEETVENEIRLADYYPDAQEILKTEVINSIISKKAVGDKLHIDGNVLFRVYYASENNGIGSASARLPFSKTFDVKKNIDKNARIDVITATQYKNARLITSRKLEVKASIGISVRVLSKCNSEYLVPSSGELEYETACVTVGNFIGYGVREQRVIEDFPLPDGKPPISTVVRSSAITRINDVRAITNKAVIKGDVLISLLYLDEKSNPEKLEYSLPVTQIVEVEGIGESTRHNSKVIVAEHKIDTVTGENGDATSIRFEGLLFFELEGYEQKQIDICTDAYSVLYGAQIKKAEISSKELCDGVTLTRAFRETLEYSSVEVTRIYDVWGDVGAVDCAKEGNIFKVNTAVNVTVVAFDSENRLCSVDSEIPVTAEIHTRNDGEYTVSPSVTLTGLSFTLSGENLIELRGEISVDAAVYSEKSFTAVTEVVLSETEKADSPLPFTVYFASEGEKLWDIAKSHNVRMADLMRHNGIESAEVDADRILKIFS